ncbi:MAG: hypothetical protein HPM95_21065 [Alphaproteobacteria bacterium]|nr:hypothetical protein [Alphaproteobacteria bacterium]
MSGLSVTPVSGAPVDPVSATPTAGASTDDVLRFAELRVLAAGCRKRWGALLGSERVRFQPLGGPPNAAFRLGALLALWGRGMPGAGRR